MPTRLESLDPIDTTELSSRQGWFIFNTNDHHAFTLTCHQSPYKAVVKDSDIGSNQTSHLQGRSKKVEYLYVAVCPHSIWL